MGKITFLDLGKQPVANGFLHEVEYRNEYFFDLKVHFDDETCLVSLVDFVPPEKMFNDEYVYHSSLSQTMQRHFREVASSFKEQFNPRKVLEIGSNDGVFIGHFPWETTIAVEPCGNFAEMTRNHGYHTYIEFWNSKTATKITQEKGRYDLVFSANCMCHIQDLNDAFNSVKRVLTNDGVFVFEDPSLLEMIKRGSYDQIYDEHAHIFSVTALNNLLKNNGLEIFKVEKLTVHGGSNRIYVKKKESNKWQVNSSVKHALRVEHEYGLGNFKTYVKFAERVEKSKEDLVLLLNNLKKQNKKIVSYGATSKSTTVFNYCKINQDQIDYITDTTKDKQGKNSPGMHIPVVDPSNFDGSVDYAFLGAWNYTKEITEKENSFLKRGGRFITHIPYVRLIEA